MKALGLGICALVALSLSGCGSPKHRLAEDGIADARYLKEIAVDAAAVKFQVPCVVVFAGDVESKLSCVYVQTADSMYFLKWSRKDNRYLPAVHLRFDEIEGIALQQMTYRRQVQLHAENRIMAYTANGDLIEDAAKSEAIYKALVASGVKAVDPVPWVEFDPPTSTPIVITVPAAK